MLIPVDTYIVMFLFNHNAREKKKACLECFVANQVSLYKNSCIKDTELLQGDDYTFWILKFTPRSVLCGMEYVWLLSPVENWNKDEQFNFFPQRIEQSWE